MSTEWREWIEDSPDWHDAGKRIEMRYEDGVVVRGVLSLDDVTPGPDEAPIFSVVLESGSKVSFFDCEQWRLA